MTRLFGVKHCRDSGRIWYGSVDMLAKLRYLLSTYRGWLKIILPILVREQAREEAHVQILYRMNKREMDVEIKALHKELSATRVINVDLLKMLWVGCIAEKYGLDEHRISG